jgi:hypothetical protein
MSDTNPAPAPAAAPSSESIIARVTGILLHPNAEWDKIDAEPATTQGLFTGYAAILAAIPAVATFIGVMVFGFCLWFVCWRPPITTSIIDLVTTYLLALVDVFVLGLVIDGLAPTFGGTKSQTQALKVAVYMSTPGWLAGIGGLIPSLAPLFALVGGLYGLYLLYLGLPKLMKAPQDKALPYFGVTLVVAVVLLFVINAVTGAVSNIGRVPTYGAYGAVGGTVHVGNASVDLGQLNQAAQQAAAASRALQAQANGQPAPAGSVQALPADTLKAMLPQALPSGFARTEVEASSGGAAGVSGANASGTYTHGDGRITLEVTDLASMGALASMASAFNVQSDRETATGYDKVSNVGGRMTEEEFDNQAHSGKYSVLVGNRFVVEANGSDVGISDLKAAVQAIDLNHLQSLAHA